MEDLHKMKKKFIKRFESSLSLIGKDLIKDMEDKYLVDEEVFITNTFNLCNNLIKNKKITPEDEKKCKEFLNFFYYLDEMKSIL